MQKKIYLTDLTEGSSVTVSSRTNGNTVEFNGTVVKVYDSFICLDIPKVDGKILSFKGVNTDVLAAVEEGALYKFSDDEWSRFFSDALANVRGKEEKSTGGKASVSASVLSEVCIVLESIRSMFMCAISAKPDFPLRPIKNWRSMKKSVSDMMIWDIRSC